MCVDCVCVCVRPLPNNTIGLGFIYGPRLCLLLTAKCTQREIRGCYDPATVAVIMANNIDLCFYK